MQTIWLVLVGLLVAVVAVPTENNMASNEIVESAPCEDTEGEGKTKCETKIYKDYLKCIEKNKSSRNKRQACHEPPITPEQVVICNNLRSQCMVNCNGDEVCQTACPICPEIVHVQVGNGDKALDISAPVYLEPGKPVINRRIIVEDGDGTYQQYQAEIDADRKITTIIRLTNIINNTNIIDMPTNINNTNVNHIHIHQNQTGGDFGMGETKEGACCFSVRPKSCRQSSSGVRCHHRRQKVCGKQCTARTIHAQTRKQCGRRGDCQRRTAYVPQPRPQCYYVDYWPYVNCGGGYEEPPCDGCYDHYGYGYEEYHGRGRRGAGSGHRSARSMSCQGCYDDGFDYGPMYRRGPVLRPMYHHQPPCYITGTCYDRPAWDDGYGRSDYMYDDDAYGFGEDVPMVDRPIDVFPDEDYEYDITPSKKEDDHETDWGVPIQKCKVISDDGTITIRNCTLTDDEDFNPFAAAPNSYPYYEPVDYVRQRDNRHRRPHPQPGYYDDYQPRPQRPHQRPPKPSRQTNSNDEDLVYDEDDNPLPSDTYDTVENFED